MSLKPKRVDFNSTWKDLKETVKGVITFSNVPRAVWNDRFSGNVKKKFPYFLIHMMVNSCSIFDRKTISFVFLQMFTHCVLLILNLWLINYTPRRKNSWKSMWQLRWPKSDQEANKTCLEIIMMPGKNFRGKWN